MRQQLKLYLLALSFVLAVTAKALAQDPAFTTIDFPDATYVTAYDINPAGEIVGRYISADKKTHGYLRSQKGALTTIDFPGALFTVALGINPRGEIVGPYRLANEPQDVRHGYLRSRGRFTTFDFPGAFWTQPLGINAGGDIVGRYCTATPCAPSSSNLHGFLLVGGEFTSINFPGAIRTGGDFGNGGINLRGDIVGLYCESVPCGFDITGGYHGFLRTQNGEFTTIDFPDAISTGAFGINPRGKIVGAYTDTSGKTHGFLAQPGPEPHEGKN